MLVAPYLAIDQSLRRRRFMSWSQTGIGIRREHQFIPTSTERPSLPTPMHSPAIFAYPWSWSGHREIIKLCDFHNLVGLT